MIETQVKVRRKFRNQRANISAVEMLVFCLMKIKSGDLDALIDVCQIINFMANLEISKTKRNQTPLYLVSNEQDETDHRQV